MKRNIWILLTLLITFLFVACNGNRDEVNTPGESNQPTDIRYSVSELAFDNLDLNINPGVGVRLVYESDNFIVFYGDFGLFGYDLVSREIVFEVDFMKAFGMNGSVQGDYGTGVEVSHDGQTIILSNTDPDNPKLGITTYYIDVPSLTYWSGEYEPLNNTYLPDNNIGFLMTTTAIGTLYYERDDEQWIFFENYNTCIPDDVLTTIENYMEAYKVGTGKAVEYMHFEEDFKRGAYSTSNDKLDDYKIESAEKINENLYGFTILVKTTQTQYSGDNYERVYNFVALIDGEWLYLNGVGNIPEGLKENLDESKFTYDDDNIVPAEDVIGVIDVN